ncbi:MAG: hypothetical protein C0483_24115 [Pirellula sp.]|nr:hypothetical protein [Pirellula sp.]
MSRVLQRWRRQIAGRHDLAERRGVREFALVGYRTRVGLAEQLVPLEQLSFVALFDERDDEDRLATRLVGARARLAETQLVIGGADNTLFDKDVRAAPCSGNGRRLDPGDAELCELALSWEKHLERVNRHPHYPRRNVLRWPTWWCEVAAAPAYVPARCHGGRTLVALEAVLELTLPILRVFADVAGLPKRQVLAGSDARRLLCGTAGPATFDLFHTRFRRA